MLLLLAVCPTLNKIQNMNQRKEISLSIKNGHSCFGDLPYRIFE